MQIIRLLVLISGGLKVGKMLRCEELVEGRESAMRKRLKMAAWVAAVAATPACATMSFEPAELQAKRTAAEDLNVEQHSLRAAVDTLQGAIHGCGVPQAPDIMQVVQGGLKDFIFGFNRDDRETPQDPALVYLTSKIAAEADAAVLATDVDDVREALHGVNVAAADLARQTAGEGLTLADVREMELAVTEARRALRVFTDAADGVELDAEAHAIIRAALNDFERELDNAGKVADALGALHANASSARIG